jgi:hypothetical protein
MLVFFVLCNVTEDADYSIDRATPTTMIYKYGGMAIPYPEAVEWGHRIDPNLVTKEEIFRTRHSGVVDATETGIALRLEFSALNAVESFIEEKGGEVRTVTHPTKHDPYIIIFTQSCFEPNAISTESKFTLFEEGDKDREIRKRLEEQDVNNIEYLTALLHH